jgi:hypothetical protein
MATSATNSRQIGPIGTTARIVVGIIFVLLAVVDSPSSGFSWLDVGTLLVVFPLLTIAVAGIVNVVYARRGTPTVLSSAPRWSPAQATAVVGALVAITALTLTPLADPATLWLFIGLSMLIAAVRGNSGCEIFEIPNMILRTNVATWCPIHTPIDNAERSRN